MRIRLRALHRIHRSNTLPKCIPKNNETMLCLSKKTPEKQQLQTVPAKNHRYA